MNKTKETMALLEGLLIGLASGFAIFLVMLLISLI
jgi:hypothetical protein